MTEKTLRVSKDLELPLQLVTHRNAVLAMSGAGKSNACVVIAEEMHRCQVPWVAFDPKGDWWGLRSSRDGKGPGLDVPILGGDHADLPLSPNAGARMGELVATGKLAGVFDMSDFAHDRQVLARFMTDFGTALLQHQRTPIHLFLDEADEYIPQPGAGGKLEGHVAHCVNAWKRVATKGRQKGIGYTLITQRTASLNKSALYMCETIIAMRTMGKRDRDAIRDFVDQHGEADVLMKSLPSLADGEAWIWSPVRLKMLQRTRFRLRQTFDSGRTPELGEALVVPKLAELDLEALRSELEQLDAKDEDDEPSSSKPGGYPAQLAAMRGRVAELERELAAKPGFQPKAFLALRGDVLNKLDRCREEVADATETIVRLLDQYAMDTGGGVHWDLKPSNGAERPPRIPTRIPIVGIAVDDPRVSPSPAPVRSVPPPRAEKPNGAASGLGKGEAAVLTAIAQHRDGVTREQLTVLTGYKKTSRDTYVQRLRAAGLVDGSGLHLAATDSGRKALGPSWKPLPTGAKLRAYWLERLGGGERAILELLIGAHPRWLSRDQVGKETSYKKTSRDTFLQRLRARRLVVDAERGGVKASDELF